MLIPMLHHTNFNFLRKVQLKRLFDSSIKAPRARLAAVRLLLLEFASIYRVIHDFANGFTATKVLDEDRKDGDGYEPRRRRCWAINKRGISFESYE